MGISYCASMRTASLGFWWCETVGGGYCSKCRDFAASTVKYLKVTWICWHTEDSHVMLLHNSRIRSPQAAQACACAVFQPQRGPSAVVLWAIEAWDILKKSFLLVWEKHPCKAEELHYPGQCRTNSGKDKERFLEDGTEDGLVWPELGLGRPFHEISATYFLLLDFLVPHFSFTMSQKRPEY